MKAAGDLTDAEWRERAEALLCDLVDLETWGWTVPREVRQMAGQLLGVPIGELSPFACLTVPATTAEIKAFLVERDDPINNYICRTEAYARTAAWEHGGRVYALVKAPAPDRSPLSAADDSNPAVRAAATRR